MSEAVKRLSQLGLNAIGGRDPEITGLSVDSRTVRPGHLFAALPGSAIHGGEFIQYALRQGAGAVLTDAAGAAIAADYLRGWDGALVVAEDPRAVLARGYALPEQNGTPCAVETLRPGEAVTLRGARAAAECRVEAVHTLEQKTGE